MIDDDDEVCLCELEGLSCFRTGILDKDEKT